MTKKKESIKEYGVDLEKQLKEATLKIKNIEQKILKRAKFLRKERPNCIVDGSPALNCDIDNWNIKYLIDFIKQIEHQYVEQTKQTELDFEKPKKI
jgi:hypothetical protein